MTLGLEPDSMFNVDTKELQPLGWINAEPLQCAKRCERSEDVSAPRGRWKFAASESVTTLQDKETMPALPVNLPSWPANTRWSPCDHFSVI
ncbi:hypothetical protein [Rubellimicrobium arenae]|uniref:hypothetical protein n=1 Tax=Rubellimicrobium arenae TaxID=2817372 RepID=UPI001B302945|nr:hypothetical protein [Rubellimicrobium arenae]